MDPAANMNTAAMPVIRLASRTPSQWANGLGETVELWRLPAADERATDGSLADTRAISASDFSMRLSIATVASNSAFSSFPGISRALMALDTPGITLVVNGKRHRLEQYHALAFSGEDDTRSVEVVESGRDLNFMVRADRGTAHMLSYTVAGSLALSSPGVAVIAVGGELSYGGVQLSFGDAIIANATVASPEVGDSLEASATPAATPVTITGEGVVAVASMTVPG